MLKLKIANHDFSTGEIALTIQNQYGDQIFPATMDELEKFLVDVAKVRMMAAIQSEKLANISKHMAEVIEKQDKAVRSILVPDDAVEVKA